MRYASITDRIAGLGSDKWEVHYRARERISQGEDIIMLSIGEPDFPAPPAVMEKAIDSLRAGRATYSDGRGEDNILSAIAEIYSTRAGREVSASQIIFMPGTQSALFVAITALAELGDEVIVPDPYYVTYDGIIASGGAAQIAALTSPDNGFHLTPDQLEAAITPKSRVLLLNSPSNPTGAVLTKREIAAIGEVCRAHDLWIVADEVYAALVYGNNTFASAFDDPDLAGRTVVTSSLSKSHAMTGYRAGWIVAPEDFCTCALPLAEAMLFGCQPFIQDAAAFALTNRFDETEAMRRAFEARGQRTVDSLNATGKIRCSMPEGGMFIFADVRETGLDGQAFAGRLLDDEDVAVMPGEVFGIAGAGHIRIGLTVADEALDQAISRIVRFAATL